MTNTHKTPRELDPLFKRGDITPKQYKTFWSNYWHLKEIIPSSSGEHDYIQDEIQTLISSYVNQDPNET